MYVNCIRIIICFFYLKVHYCTQISASIDKTTFTTQDEYPINSFMVLTL